MTAAIQDEKIKGHPGSPRLAEKKQGEKQQQPSSKKTRSSPLRFPSHGSSVLKDRQTSKNRRGRNRITDPPTGLALKPPAAPGSPVKRTGNNPAMSPNRGSFSFHWVPRR